MIPKIDVRKAVVLTEALMGHVPYGWAYKVPNDISVPEFIYRAHRTGVDCSGFICWLLYQVSQGQINLSMGSYEVHDYYASQMQTQVYANRAHLRDGVFRLCGFPPAGGEAGHIWGVVDGLTLESHGKNLHGNGIDRRPWDTPVLLRHQPWCFEMTSPTKSINLSALYNGVKVYDKAGVLIWSLLDVPTAVGPSDAVPGRLIIKVGK